MREVLLADVALWAALIAVAALIIIRRWRRSRSWIPARGPREEAPELADQQMLPPRAARVIGPGKDTRTPDGVAPRSAMPVLMAPPHARRMAPVAPPQATRMAPPQATRRAPAAPPQATKRALAAPPQATKMADPKARPHRPAARPDGRRTPTGPATPSERIASYYDQADQPIADYLEALGWAQQPPTPPVRRQAQIRVLPQSPETVRPPPRHSARGAGTRQDGRQGRDA